MIQTFTLYPGITLRCFPDERFKQGCLSLQFVQQMRRETAALNALLPAVLLRGTESAPDLRAITLRLDDLYGASVGALVRRVGDYQTTGLHCSFVGDRFAMAGDGILAPMVEFLQELLLRPALENGAFSQSFVESEKKNLMAAIESQRNDKRAYCNAQLLKEMCAADSFGIPRLGEITDVQTITPAGLYDQYQKLLKHSRIELFYVGGAAPEEVSRLLQPMFAGLERDYIPLPEQTGFHSPATGDHTEQMDIAQGKLAMGFTTPITLRDPRYPAMQLLNTVFGGGMTSKLFMQVREKMSLCYDIGSGYHGSKGILAVFAGIDFEKEPVTRQQIFAQLEACKRGEISPEELNAAKQAVISSLRGTHDSPGAIENYYATTALSGLGMTPQEYMEKLAEVRAEEVTAAANTLQLHTTYFLKGVQA